MVLGADTFWGQAVRGGRSWQEVVAVAGGFSDPTRWGQGMLGEGPHGRLFGPDQAMRDIRSWYTPREMGRRAMGMHGGRSFTSSWKPTGFFKHGKAFGKGFALFVPIEIGARALMGERVHEAAIKSTVSAVTGALAAGVAGGIAGTFLAPGVGTAVGFVAGIVGSMAGEAAGDVGMRFLDHLSATGRRVNRAELGGRLSSSMMTRSAYTMRARALQQMNRSGVNARSLLGREAVMMHLR